MPAPHPNAFESGLEANAANYVPLSPLSFIKRVARVFPQHPAIIHGDLCQDWATTYQRCRRFASALTRRGIGRGDTVAIIAPNTPAIYEASFAVAMNGAVLNTLNTRLDPSTLAFSLDHGGAKVLLSDREFSDTVQQTLDRCRQRPLVIDIDDALAEGGELIGDIEYEAFLASGDAGDPWQLPDDEWQAISLNYTSGTTGNPKGVVYHHRGAYLNALSNALGWDMGHHPVYLWTLPMFHCNGWCYPWTLAAMAGTSICLRKVSAASIYAAIADHGVSHLCGAPIILSFILNASPEERREFSQPVSIMTAAAPPPAAVLEAIQQQGFRITHVYGLTETYGPATLCAWKGQWDGLPADRQAALKSRQGVPYHVLEDLQVMDPDSMQPVAADGESLGEVMFRGNIVMKGYLNNPQATSEAFRGGWFHSGDLGVMHPDGYIQLKDRSKDIIISGGENISSIELEDVLYRHPAVAEAAVVARQDAHWGEVPCAFVSLHEQATPIGEADIIAYCREHLARFKVPKYVVFGELPKTSTGKIQKFKLREVANSLSN